MKIRQALNVEAGLNDGLSVPFLLFFIAFAGTAKEGHATRLTGFIVEQLGYGTLVGLSIGLLGGWLLGLAAERKWMAHSWQQLGVVALPLLCLVASDTVGASMFIAAFVCGLAVQAGFKEAGKHSVEFAEEWGQLFNLSVFFLFGILVARAWSSFTPANVLYAILSLTIIRMVPVALALDRHRPEPRDRTFHGLVWPARSGLHRSRTGLFGRANASARGDDHQAGGDDDRAAEYFRARIERSARDGTLRPKDRNFANRRTGACGPRHGMIQTDFS